MRGRCAAAIQTPQNATAQNKEAPSTGRLNAPRTLGGPTGEQLSSTVSQRLSIRPLSEGLDCLVAFSEEQDDEEAVHELQAPDVRVVQVESRTGSDSAV